MFNTGHTRTRTTTTNGASPQPDEPYRVVRPPAAVGHRYGVSGVLAVTQSSEQVRERVAAVGHPDRRSCESLCHCTDPPAGPRVARGSRGDVVTRHGQMTGRSSSGDIAQIPPSRGGADPGRTRLVILPGRSRAVYPEQLRASPRVAPPEMWDYVQRAHDAKGGTI